MNNNCMRIAKQRGGETIFPVSLSHFRDDEYGKDTVLGGKTIAEHEIYICMSGEAVVYVGDNTYTVKRGTILTYKPEEEHRTYVTGLQPYERYVLLFHHDCFAQLWDGAQDNLFAMFSQRENYQKNAIHLLPQDFQQLRYLLERAIGYAVSQNSEKEGLFLIDFIKIMQLLSRGFLSTDLRDGISTRVPVVNMALEMIEKNFCELQRVDQVSGKLNVSDSYLARMFKKQVGTSVYEYILNMKFAHAVKLLGKGYSVTDACFESGFNSYSHFIQMFKRRYGVTPRKYKTNMDV